MATIKDVAQSAQVSATTVSRVLNRDDNMSVTPEVRMRIFQAAHALGYVSPRQRRAAAEKTKLIIGVADWRIIRPDRPNIRLSSLSCLVQMMTDQYDVSFIRLVFGHLVTAQQHGFGQPALACGLPGKSIAAFTADVSHMEHSGIIQAAFL